MTPRMTACRLLAVLSIVASASCGKTHGPGPPIGDRAAAAGCSAPQQFPSAGQAHIPAPEKGTYNSDPPTSGAHYSAGAPNGPGYTGVQSGPIQDEIEVHNLEHGHVGIQYDPTRIAPDVKATLETFTKTNVLFTFMAPRPGLKDVIALSAWRELSTCAHPTTAVLVGTFARAFYDAFHDKAPESIPGTPVR